MCSDKFTCLCSLPVQPPTQQALPFHPPTHTDTHRCSFTVFRPWSTDERLNMRVYNPAIIMAGLQSTSCRGRVACPSSLSEETQATSLGLRSRDPANNHRIKPCYKSTDTSAKSLTWQSKSWKFRPFCEEMKKSKKKLEHMWRFIHFSPLLSFH